MWIRWLLLAGSMFFFITAAFLMTFQGVEFWKALIQLVHDYFNNKT